MCILYYLYIFQLDDLDKKNKSLKNENELLEIKTKTVKREKDTLLLEERKMQDQINLVNSYVVMYMILCMAIVKDSKRSDNSIIYVDQA